MNPEELIYTLVVTDIPLYNPPPQTEAFIKNLISVAKTEIAREGIQLNVNDIDHAQTVAMYASYLYRRRSAPQNGMPRMLRWRLNNLLFSQKAKASE